MNCKIILLLCFITIVITRNYAEGRLTEVIQTEKGQVRGEIVKTIHNESIEYSAFRGIPFAKPPIGELRFQPPVESDAWTDVLNATSEVPSCPQINEDIDDYDGDEDCLYLNVYSPKTSFNKTDDEQLGVIVWIYGGALTAGVIYQDTYGPDFLIADNVIVVAMNYRLGALGFLSLNIDGATGNQGFKDQVLALKWIQINIKNFGGDPNRVTIFGLSSGAQCVALQQLSPASKGLFKSAIIMSGGSLGISGSTSTELAVKQAFEFSSHLGLIGLNETQLLDELRKIPAEALVQALTKQKMAKTSSLGFGPAIENPSIAKDIFLSTCPLNMYQKREYSMMPIIIGHTNAETLVMTGGPNSISNAATTSVEYFTKLGLENLWFIDGLKTLINRTVDDLNDDEFYFGVNMTSDVYFNVGVDSTQRYLAQSSYPIYYYRNSFDYEGSRHRLLGINREGCAHADDVAHIFWQPVKKQPQDPTTRIGVHRARMARLWTNFVKYSNPTPNGTSDPLLNFTWFPSQPEDLRLEIGNEIITMEPRVTSEPIKAIQGRPNAFETC